MKFDKNRSSEPILSLDCSAYINRDAAEIFFYRIMHKIIRQDDTRWQIEIRLAILGHLE